MCYIELLSDTRVFPAYCQMFPRLGRRGPCKSRNFALISSIILKFGPYLHLVLREPDVWSLRISRFNRDLSCWLSLLGTLSLCVVITIVVPEYRSFQHLVKFYYGSQAYFSLYHRTVCFMFYRRAKRITLYRYKDRTISYPISWILAFSLWGFPCWLTPVRCCHLLVIGHTRVIPAYCQIF